MGAGRILASVFAADRESGCWCCAIRSCWLEVTVAERRESHTRKSSSPPPLSQLRAPAWGEPNHPITVASPILVRRQLYSLHIVTPPHPPEKLLAHIFYTLQSPGQAVSSLRQLSHNLCAVISTSALYRTPQSRPAHDPQGISGISSQCRASLSSRPPRVRHRSSSNLEPRADHDSRQAHRAPHARRAQSLLRQRAHLSVMAQLHRHPGRPRRRPPQLW